MPWTIWGRFAHNSPRARVEVHLPRVLESRSVGQRALAPPTDGHPPAFRNPQRQFSHYATAFQLRYGRNQPPLNHFPNHPTTAFQPRPNHRKPQPLHNRPSPPQPSFSRQTDDSALGKNPRLNHPSCRIQERFRLNHPTSTILESTTSSCTGSARPSTASVVASLPTPPATRRRSPSCRQCCHERCRRRESQTLVK